MEAFWKKFQFWKNWTKPKTPEEGVDYEFYHIEDSDLTGIKLLKGSYREVTYYYGTVKMQDQGALATLSFEYRILKPGNHTEESLQIDDDFVKLLGDILTEIIINESAQHEQIRKDHSEEFDLY